MKKILLILALLVVSLFSYGQVQQESMQIRKKANHVYNYEKKEAFFIPNPDTLKLINVTNISAATNNGWAVSGKTCAGCASFFYKILRSKNTIYGEDGYEYFYFFFYFYSNSYYTNAEPATTYLTGLRFFVNDKFIFDVPYLLLEPDQVVYAAWTRSVNPNSKISFDVTKVNVH